MTLFRLASLAFVALWLAGCAPRGELRADDGQLTAQQRQRAVQQWDRLASDVAVRAADAVRRLDGPPLPVYVGGSRDTPFDDGFRELLRTRLVENNVPVATSLIAGGLELRYDAQVIAQQNEVLISTALQNTDQYLARTSNAWRITPAERSLYWRAPPPPPVAVKNWQVVQW
jgi:hypothetical protein